MIIRDIKKMKSVSLFLTIILCVIGMKFLKKAIPDTASIKVLTDYEKLLHHLSYHNVFIASKDKLEEINDYVNSNTFNKIDFTTYFTKANTESFGILYRDITGLIKVF